jgi:hypothetical protein
MIGLLQKSKRMVGLLIQILDNHQKHANHTLKISFFREFGDMPVSYRRLIWLRSIAGRGTCW